MRNALEKHRLVSTHAVYSRAKIDLKMSPITLTDHYTLFFGFSGHKLNHSEKENDDDRMIKMRTKLNDPKAIINIQFYMQHEIQKFELTPDQLSCEEAMKIFQFLLNKCIEKFLPTKIWDPFPLCPPAFRMFT